MKRIYLDNCCLNRPFDNQDQVRIRLESEAIRMIMKRVRLGILQWISSEVVDDEIWKAKPVRRKKLKALLDAASKNVQINEEITRRAATLQRMGFRGKDAFHVACAEAAGVDAMLTTDDRLYRCAERQANSLLVRVANPLTWVAENPNDDDKDNDTGKDPASRL